MESTSLPRHEQQPINFQDEVNEKIAKAKSILTCVMFSSEYLRKDMTMDNHTIYHALWAVDEYLDQIDKLFNS